jgi:hypothetical protein
MGKLAYAKYSMNYHSSGGSESNGSSAMMLEVQLYLKCSCVSTRQHMTDLVTVMPQMHIVG